jgi:starvation-inducible DNA-binding protein
LSDAIDEIAERVRALGEDAPASMQTFLALSRVDDKVEACKDIKEGIKLLADDHEQLASLMVEQIAMLEEYNDYATIDLLTDRVKEHDKFAWLLRSNL